MVTTSLTAYQYVNSWLEISFRHHLKDIPKKNCYTLKKSQASFWCWPVHQESKRRVPII